MEQERATKQCSLCGRWLPLSAFIGRAKDCTECRTIEALRPPRGRAPVERAMTPPGAWAKMRGECRATTLATNVPHAIDHIVPIRGKVRRGSDDYVLICGLDVPANWQIIPKGANGEKWMRFSNADARAEEARLMRFAKPSTDH
jgi:hypothetical protein